MPAEGMQAARAAAMPVEVKAAGTRAAARGMAMAEGETATAAGMPAARAGDRTPCGWPDPLNRALAVMNDPLSLEYGLAFPGRCGVNGQR